MRPPGASRPKSRWRLAAIAALAAAVAIALAARTLGPAAGDGVPLLAVERTDFQRRVRAEGNLQAVRATPILVPSEVRRPYKIAWLAPEGRLVRQGGAVLRFDPSELETSTQEARARYQTTELEMVKRSTSASAEASNLGRDAELAGAELETVRSFQKRDETIYSRFEIVEAEVDEELASERQRHAETSRLTKESLARTELDLLALEKRQSRREIERNEKALGLLEVLAPHDGVLVVERDWHGTPMRVGNTVFSGQKVGELPDLSQMKAEVFVLEADAGGLAVGQPAEVVVESAPRTVYAARVSRVDTLAKPRLEGSPVQYFGATLELETTDPAVMKPGQRVSATILIDDLKDVLVVPRQAVVDREDGSYVFRRTGGGFEEVAVTLAASGLGRLVVSEGLAAGDLIAARDPGRSAEALGPAAAGDRE